LNEIEIKEYFGELGINMKIEHNSYSYLVYHVFLFRRIAFGLIPITFVRYKVFQPMCLVFLNQFCLMFYAGVYPYDSYLKNRNEVFNEVIMMILTYHILLFTEFINEPSTRYEIGKSFLGFLALLITVNLIILVVDVLQKYFRKKKLD
jgi:hypothetical protein